jgi:hypothetical protein
MDRRGGADAFGIGPAEIRMALKHIVGAAVGKGLKRGLPDNVLHHALPNAPPELVQVMPRLPAWIAIDEGVNAVWIPSLKATVEQWMANAKLKETKARETMKKANASADMAEFLIQYGINSLAETMQMEAAE